jgi:hypothetical protein
MYVPYSSFHHFVEKIIEELENFKNEKTPGIDGLTIDYF